MDEVPEESMAEAEAPAFETHDHRGVAAEDGTLRAHLHRVHRLEVPHAMSPATQVGVHDRLHQETGAADD